MMKCVCDRHAVLAITITAWLIGALLLGSLLPLLCGGDTRRQVALAAQLLQPDTNCSADMRAVALTGELLTELRA